MEGCLSNGEGSTPIKNYDDILLTLVKSNKDSSKSDSHVSENFCQVKIFPSLVRNNTIICLLGD